MKLTLVYTYTPELTRQIYVARAHKVDGSRIELADSQLSPAARAAALDALAPCIYSGVQKTVDDKTTGVQPLASCEHLTLGVVALVGDEPTVTQAVEDAERILLAAVAASPRHLAAWEAELERRAAVRAAADADADAAEAALRARIEAAGLECCLRQIEGTWQDTYAPDSRETNDRKRAVLGADCYERAKAEAELRNAALEEAQASARATRRVEETAWIAQYANDLADRHAEGLLPDAELAERLRDHMFARLVDVPRYARLVRGDVNFTEECDPDATVSFDVEDADEMDAGEYARLRLIRQLAPGGASVQAREHSGSCDCRSCGDRKNTEVSRRSALVTLTVLGRQLSREYAL